MQPVTIYTKPTCPYCLDAKALLQQKGCRYKEINIQGNNVLREEMIQKANGRTTVPQIFIGDTYVGGCDDLYALEDQGRLEALLNK